MDSFDPATYGQRIADSYDAWYGQADDETVRLLADLAAGGRVLELGIGTGRIALPLHDLGVDIEGIDASEAMVAKLRAKPDGDRIPVAMGDFADVAVDGHYEVVYLLFNTLFALRTQEEQVRCFQNVAGHLGPRGVFLVEAFVPDLGRFHGGQAVRAVHIGEGEARLDVSELDLVGQRITTQHVVLNDQGVRLYPVDLRFAWPSELDLMARLAGLRLKHRWGSWAQAPFSAQSTKHVSVYERAPSVWPTTQSRIH
jgi:SAM-dependent methyltransferase